MGEMSDVTKAAAQNPFHGQILDSDGHLYLTPDDMLEFTREIGEPPFIDFYQRFYKSSEYQEQRDKRRDIAKRFGVSVRFVQRELHEAQVYCVESSRKLTDSSRENP